MRASSGSSDRAVLAAVALGGTLLPLNSTMLAVALPDIASDTGGGVAATSWLVTASVVAMATLGPFAGRLGDRLGRRRMLPPTPAWRWPCCRSRWSPSRRSAGAWPTGAGTGCPRRRA